MEKGTNVAEMAQVFKDARAAGIRNHVYIMAGFPTETRAEYLDTLLFLEANQKVIGRGAPRHLQSDVRAPRVFDCPEKFGLTPRRFTRRFGALPGHTTTSAKAA